MDCLGWTRYANSKQHIMPRRTQQPRRIRPPQTVDAEQEWSQPPTAELSGASGQNPSGQRQVSPRTGRLPRREGVRHLPAARLARHIRDDPARLSGLVEVADSEGLPREAAVQPIGDPAATTRSIELTQRSRSPV